MKRSFIIFITIAATIASIGFVPFLDNEKGKVLLDIITKSIESYHYSPHSINDDFSKKTFDLYIDALDRSKRIFLQEDIDKLSAHKLSIDDQVKANSLLFLDESVELYLKRMANVDEYINEALAKPFDFNQDEYIELDEEKIPFAKTESELKEYWRKSLKYQVLTRVYNAMEVQVKDTLADKSFETLESEARTALQKIYTDWYNRISKSDSEDLRATYFNAITTTYDPHTNYFPPEDKANFDIAMSGQLEGIGATLQEFEGFIKIVQVIPGSPAWKSGELKEGDFIMKVAQGANEPVELMNMRIDDAVKLIRGKKGTEVRLTLKKVSGDIINVSLIRDIVVLEETYAKSAILTQPGTNKKIGYIYLPKFYADFNNNGGRYSANDIRVELEKLQTEKIDALIFDIRNNGGGSLSDVVDMAGLFIEQGPIVQVKGRKNSPEILADKDSRIQYSGPLVVMVNSFSASASEILAGAIQDYKRGLIVGSTSTFGKGTVQRFIDFDQALPASFNAIKPLGSIKMTIQKFYRITGQTTQLKGVVPDIILPDANNYLEVGEKELDAAMPWDVIPGVKYNEWKSGNKTWDELIKKSKTRIKKSDYFNDLEKYAKLLEQQNEETKISLNYAKYKEYEQKRKAELNFGEKYKSYKSGLDAHNLAIDLNKIEADSSRVSLNKSWLDQLQKDAQLFEVFQIASELNK